MPTAAPDRPGLADRLFFKITQPHNLARILRWAWLISLMMLVFGYLIIYFRVSEYLNI
ncbi:hypothetical protein [Methanohalophilus portucalensis]|jgi:hypothetical protein|uniref:Uncharacterized protein n=1 Tax=Methanohalophilus portucalensis FDF-1 TaxID=523843 RepID=A0A1L9C4E3_9EURY|nr:hypothetical protein [Methanohalophilus portucalensis]OJH49395.1 hypothetical protein MPF_1262 [Methanohalophilus portucalensis FDF-1]SMH41159.1 hypothetical protein SAMN06264941_1607 [Methanohalophilus portucalensis FDF-1]